MLTWIAVLVGGALGSAARHGVNIVAPRLFGNATPYATATVNMIGALAIGVLAGMLEAQRLSMTPIERALYLTGILGGFTTFSSFMLDSLVLWQAGSDRQGGGQPRRPAGTVRDAGPRRISSGTALGHGGVLVHASVSLGPVRRACEHC